MSGMVWRTMSGITVVVDDEPGVDTARARIMLCMIVKNEERVIRRCLEAALPIVDAASICDTGSTDDTRAVIAETLDAAGISYRIHRHDWVNFGHNRTRSFQEAKKFAGDLGWNVGRSWALFLDADMVLEVDDAFDASALQADSYLLRQGGESFFYYNTRLARLALDWRSIGATHEYWAAEGAQRGERLDTLRIHDIGDGGAKADKFERDIRLLEAELREQPDNARAMFYLAQSYFDVGRYADAHAMYQRRAAAGGWDEEAWYAAYMAGRASVQAGEWERGVGELLAAWQRRPWRAEPLYELARSARMQGDSHLAMLAAERALRIPSPESDSLFISTFAHAEGPLEEVSISAWYTGQRALGLEAVDTLLHSPTAPQGTRLLAGNNAMFYAQPLPLASSRRIEAPRKVLEPYYTASTGAIHRADDGYVMIQRLVNYHKNGTRYYSLDPSGQIRTKNAWVRLDNALAPVACTEIDHRLLDQRSAHPPESLRIYGLEDCRLVRWRGDWWFTATCWHFDPDMRPSMVLGRLDPSGSRLEQIVPLDYPRRAPFEKNWLPFVHAGRLLLLYASDPFVVLEPDPETGRCREIHRSTPPLRLDRYRGSAPPIPWGDGYLYSIHEVAFMQDRRVYRHRFVELDRELAVRRISRLFMFQGGDIEYSCGHCLSHDGSMLLISHSWEDQQSWVSGVAVEDVERLLVPVDNLAPTIAALRQLYAS